MPGQQRRLTAIVCADVAGYSRLMGADEEGTLAALKAHRRELVDPQIASHGGRIVKTTGDGLLLEFPSVVQAVRCAIAVQSGMAERNTEVPAERRIAFRVGINLGDIIVDGDDIFGDGVNIAARLQEIAEPGGICLSTRVHEDVRDRLDAAFADAGEQALKNIARPVRVWRWHAGGSEPAAAGATALALPDKPSIAVLPFTNMSGDPEQEYFADGVSEDIITELSRFRSLFVIARNSTFTYKGKAVDVRQVARELGVRYVLEGSIRKGANRVRVTAQLIDALTGNHLWAERYDRVIDDVFTLQDELTTSVVGALIPNLELAEIERSTRKPTASLDAYDYYLRGLACSYRWSKASYDEALEHFRRAIAHDPNFAVAYGMAARCYIQRKARGWMVDRAQETAEGAQLARRARELGGDDAFALTMAAHALALLARDLDAGVAAIDRALSLNPNMAIAWAMSGWIRLWLGEPERAKEHTAHAMRLSPRDPLFDLMRVVRAHADFLTGAYEQAADLAELVLQGGSESHPVILRIAAASHAFAGHAEAAARAREQLLLQVPGWRVGNLIDNLGPYRRPEDVAKFAEGLRLAGLPE